MFISRVDPPRGGCRVGGLEQRVRKEYGKDCPAVPPQWVASVGVPLVVVSAAGSAAGVGMDCDEDE